MLFGTSDSNISGDKDENSRGLRDYWIVETDSPLTIERAFKMDGLRVFPNPVTDILYIAAETSIKKVELLDALGRTVSVFNLNADQFQLNTATLTAGIYLLRATDGERAFTQPVVKE